MTEILASDWLIYDDVTGQGPMTRSKDGTGMGSHTGSGSWILRKVRKLRCTRTTQSSLLIFLGGLDFENIEGKSEERLIQLGQPSSSKSPIGKTFNFISYNVFSVLIVIILNCDSFIASI